MVGGFLVGGLVHGEDVVIVHAEVAAEVVFWESGVNVVGGIDVDFAFVGVGRGIGGVDVFDQGLGDGLELFLFGHGGFSSDKRRVAVFCQNCSSKASVERTTTVPAGSWAAAAHEMTGRP